MMLNTGAFPSVERECTLSSILEANVPEKYSLSPKAAKGILLRAKRYGNELNPTLLDALQTLAAKLPTDSTSSKSTPRTDDANTWGGSRRQ